MHETTVYVCASKLWGAETLRHHTSLLSLTQVVANKVSKNHVCLSVRLSVSITIAVKIP